MAKSIVLKISFLFISLTLFTLNTSSYISIAHGRQQFFTTPPMASSQFDIIAHRGACGYAPEHTLAAYKQAVDMGVDYVEIDLHMTKDGELVAIHDKTLSRTTNVEKVYPHRGPSWRVRDFTLAEIKKLDAGSWFNNRYPEYAKKEYSEERIPSLREVIRVVKEGNQKVSLYIETKDPGNYPGLEEKLVSILEKSGLLQDGKVVFQSFSEESLRTLKTLVPEDIPLIQLFSIEMLGGKNLNNLLHYTAEYADGIGVEQSVVTRELVKRAKKYELIVHSYTVNTEEEMHKQISLGVDGMFTDYPNRLKSVINRSNSEFSSGTIQNFE